MRKRFPSGVFAVLLVAAASFAPGQKGSQPEAPMGRMSSQTAGKMAAQAAGPLKITFGEKSAEWTPAELEALPQTTVKVYNGHAKANQTYAGVPLIDLLTKLGVADKPRGKQLRLYVEAEGSDGYEVVYSIGEITPDVHNGTVMVAYREDGEALKGNGPFQLVATGEKRRARWVRNLVAIQVMTAE